MEEYLKREERLYAEILENLSKSAVSEKTKERMMEVKEVLQLNQKALSYFA